eukprot:6809283-Alexandrium_andersonii.AAC.1
MIKVQERHGFGSAEFLNMYDELSFFLSREPVADPPWPRFVAQVVCNARIEQSTVGPQFWT